MELLGRPPPAYGLKFLTKAGSPEPVITRHGWPAFVEPAPAVTAGAAAAPPRITRSPVRATTSGREEERRIGWPFLPVLAGVLFNCRERVPDCYQDGRAHARGFVRRTCSLRRNVEGVRSGKF